MHPRDTTLLGPLGMAAIGCLLLSCKVGPDYARPAVERPAMFKSDPGAGEQTPPIQAEWWRLYNEPELDELVLMASESNQNIRQAVARVDQARALSRVAASFLFPTVTANADYTRTRTSANRPSPTTGTQAGRSTTFNDWQVPVDLSYEIDIWGRVRRSIESSDAQAAAAVDDLAFVYLTVTTDVATYYFAIRALDAQEQILQETVTAYAEQVRIVSVQLKNGLVAPSDLYQAQAQWESTRAQLRDVQRARADLEHALAVLCGRPAPLFDVSVDPLLEASPPVVPAGLPGELLTRRPDVAAAEQNVISFNAQVGVSKAALYPTFTLTGSAGFESVSASSLLDWKSRVLAIGPGLSLPIFDMGRRRANLAASRAQYDQAVAAYVNQVLTAYSDVEDALTDLHAFTDEVGRLRAAVGASDSYLRIARAQYKQGLVNYLVVVDAERTLLTNQLTLSQNRNQQMAASIRLIKALGGGWDADASTSD